jgi:demethylmenaquinone methyltransferase/2-methoxy-6-polyprenyl-1,4-benzoquinol methylase
MASKFFEPGARRSAKVHELFAKIAPRYDLINDLQSFGLHRYWKGRVVNLAQVKTGMRALDVCCGTGDLALALARRGASVTGVDFSEEMLEVARGREEKVQSPESKVQGSRFKVQSSESGTQAEGQQSGIQFVCGDAERLPFSDNSFEVVTIGYGLRNLASFEMGLKEMQRVAKDGGRLIVLDFGKPENRVLRALYFGYLRLFVPLLGLVFCRSADAYSYILESLKHYSAQRGVAEAMERIGLVNVRIINLLGGIMSINYGEKR